LRRRSAARFKARRSEANGGLAATCNEGVTPMFDREKIMESVAKHREALAEAWKLNREVFFCALSAAHITRVTVTFDGEGDSGQIDNIAAYKGDEPVPLPDQAINLRTVSWNDDAITIEKKPLDAAIERLCYDFLEQEHEGWENNDGAYGEFTFDVAQQTVALEFNGRFTDVHTSSHTF